MDAFNAYLRYEQLSAWLHGLALAHPDLVTVESYGRSNEGRELLLATVTDSSTGAHHTKPAQWVDANIHATELTASVAACYLLHRLVTGFTDGAPEIVTALRTRTFYVVPRVNPDGAEWALADRPRLRRSSTRPWPWTDGHRWPGLHTEDIDGDGRVLQMRIDDPHGGWVEDATDPRLLIPVPPAGVVDGRRRFRLLDEGLIEGYDGFTVPLPRAVEGLDLNRNFPAGWGTTVTGSGDHPLSEPEIDALIRAVVARPNVCGYNAFHTSGGILLRPSSTRGDDKLPPTDVWTWQHLGEIGTALTGYPVHSVYEDFTWDRAETMSGAADDWAYEHLGVYGWTTEFWDIIERATGTKPSTKIWYVGPTDAEALAVLRWCDEHHPEGYVDWYPFDHPQLGPVELGGWNALTTWINPPAHLLAEEVAGHATFAVRQALAAPCLEIVRCVTRSISADVWRIEIGVANTGWLPTDVSAWARSHKLVPTCFAELGGDGVDLLDQPARQAFGPLDGSSSIRFRGGNDGTPDRALLVWTVRAERGATATVTVAGARAGTTSLELILE